MFRKAFVTIAGCMFSTLIPAFAAENQAQLASEVRQAENFYGQARYGYSLSLLDKHARDPSTVFLIGRDYYMLGDFKRANIYLKKAIAAAPETSEYFDWLGRAYARRAETSNPLSAVILSKKARQAFERAVQLNPKNSEAVSDLFDYYLESPRLLGRSYERAGNVAERMSAINRDEASFEEWRLAGKRQPLQTGEQAAGKSSGPTPKDLGALVRSVR
ncbi:MAG: hypothetical protein JO270_07875 [Acidobacteriaceae bacterium]|nr:hypothetical protein [Acidobacteriaceae bacterium]MBV8572254.1 hypothetical protein [Acidobacteriaceae bacterium]